MKIILIIFLSLFIFSSCGKKSDPKYQALIIVNNSQLKNV
tara:strand:- start:278 stop:397 length:120 start_codon:yes stop_codon:yes gene_type:complete